MGVGNLQIGIGEGGAQLFGHNPAIQQFGEILAQRKQKQEQDNKFLNEQLATNYDPGALRNDVDKSTYLKKYNDIKTQAIDAENEKDQTKRALKIAEIRQQLGNLSAWGEGSKKQAVIDKQLAMEFMKNPDHYEDDSINKYKAGLQKQWDDDGVINNASMVERRVDPSKLSEDYKKFKEEQIKPTQWTNGTKKTYTFDGKKKQVIEQNRGIPIDGDNGAYETMLHKVASDPKWKKGLKDLYPDINTGDPQVDMALRTRKYMHDNGDEQGWFDKPKEISMEGQSPIRPSFRDIQYHKKFGVWPTGDPTSTEPSPSQTMIVNMKNQLPGSGEKFVNLAPPNQYDGKKPWIGIIPETGEHWFKFPAQIDQKAKAANEELKAKWERNNPGQPYDETVTGYKLKNDIKFPAVDKKLNPASPTYVADVAELAKNQNINLAQLDKIESVKGGKGQIAEAKMQPKSTYKASNGKAYSHADLLKLGYTEEQIKEAIKLGNLK